ncbi:MAG: peptidoglycan bridge formation protein FemAB, partial [Burkholderiaceae bacterium]
MPTVEQLLPGDLHAAASWDAFVLACPQATFFHRSGWQRLMREVFRHDTYYLFAHSGGRITGVLPLAHVRSLLFGKSLSSLPFAAYGGIAADDEDSAAALQQEAESLARRLGVAHLELRHL